MDELKVGDSVKVIVGDYLGAYGVIEAIDGHVVTVSRALTNGEIFRVYVELGELAVN